MYDINTLPLNMCPRRYNYNTLQSEILFNHNWTSNEGLGPPRASAITLLLARGVLSQPMLSYWCVQYSFWLVFSNIINAALCQQRAWSACSSRPHALARFTNTWLFSSPPLSHFYLAEAQWQKKKLAALVTWTRLGRDIEQVRCQQITEKTSQ